MSSKRDMRRPDLVVPYAESQDEKKDTDLSSTFASTMPMAAVSIPDIPSTLLAQFADVGYGSDVYPQQNDRLALGGTLASKLACRDTRTEKNEQQPWVFVRPNGPNGRSGGVYATLPPTTKRASIVRRRKTRADSAIMNRVEDVTCGICGFRRM